MSAAPKRLLTPEEYLAQEELAEFRSEYYRGEVFAMSGASFHHGRINENLSQKIGNQLEDSPCQIITRDLRVRVAATGLYTYPDAVIFCGPPELSGGRTATLLNPRVLIEILSDSTEDYDRGGKFVHYRQIPSLQEYVLIAQAEALVEHYVRQSDGGWLLTACAVVPKLSSLTGSSCTRISRSAPPDRSILPTPGRPCNPRLTTSSTNQDSSSNVNDGAVTVKVMMA